MDMIEQLLLDGLCAAAERDRATQSAKRTGPRLHAAQAPPPAVPPVA